jgi:hypothetical protein
MDIFEDRSRAMMNDMDQHPLRDANGRFQPGQSGNPAGKKSGTRNRATLLREAMNDGEDGEVARVIIDKALAGNAATARFVIGLLIPRARDRAIELDLPDGAGIDDLVAAANETVRAMAAGEISPEEALTVTRVLDFRLKAVMAAGKEARNPARAQKSPSPLAGETPSPLAGEGRGEGARAGMSAPLMQPPHPSIAIAMGPSLSRKGRGALLGEGRGSFSRDLLHSTCISRPLVPLRPPGHDAAPASLTGVRLAA